jgi:hypothetical protein
MAAALLLAVAIPAFAAAPKAVPVEPVKDFDIVVKGDVITHVFLIKNEGDAPLKINDVRPACGCTVAHFDKQIAPGETGKVTVRVKTQDFNGPISKAVSVLTSDSQNPKLQLVVKAKVQPFIAVIPGYARYNYVQGEAEGTISQTLWADDGADIKILKIKSLNAFVKVDFHEATKEERNEKGAERQWRVDITLAKNAPVGALRNYVEVMLDHPKQKSVRIPVSGFVRPRQHLTPEKINLGSLESASLPLRQSLHLTSFITEEIEITKVETGYEGLQAEIVPSEKQSGHRFKVFLTVGAAMPKGAFDGTIKFHTTDKVNPVVELPIKGTIL